MKPDGYGVLGALGDDEVNEFMGDGVCPAIAVGGGKGGCEHEPVELCHRDGAAGLNLGHGEARGCCEPPGVRVEFDGDFLSALCWPQAESIANSAVGSLENILQIGRDDDVLTDIPDLKVCALDGLKAEGELGGGLNLRTERQQFREPRLGGGSDEADGRGIFTSVKLYAGREREGAGIFRGLMQ